MTGKSHLVANSCSALLAYDGIKYLQHNPFSFFNITSDSILTPVVSFLSAGKGFNNIVFWGLAFVLFFLGTLLPDCDNDKSLLGRFIYIPVEHRTWTHTLWVVIPIFVMSIWWRVLFYLGAGYLLHLFWDSLSSCGVAYMYPITKYKSYGKAKVKKGHIFKLYKTGKASEYVVLAFLVILTIVVATYVFLFVK